MNSKAKIADLRELSEKWQYNQIVVLAINSETGDYTTVSYGKMRKLCDAAGEINEQIYAAVADGNIRDPTI